jgi:NAD(P)-dependent dehydrogenase (short-subunit alcohol dehydrogenase family)
VFEDAVAVVTGAASGIGRALAAALAARGATVVLADLDGPGAASAAGALGHRAEAAVVDVTDAGAVRRLVEGTVARHGRLDLLFNNAGIGGGGPVEDLDVAAWRRVVDVDLLGVVHGVAAAYPLMVRQGSGHIVNTASLAGLMPAPHLTPYAAAKHAVVGLSVTLRVEAAAHGVHVTAVCPGPVETPILDTPGPVDARALLTAALGEPHPAEHLAEDVLEGVAANRALIVAPESARAAWAAYRRDPEGVLATMAARDAGSAAARGHPQVTGT